MSPYSRYSTVSSGCPSRPLRGVKVRVLALGEGLPPTLSLRTKGGCGRGGGRRLWLRAYDRGRAPRKGGTVMGLVTQRRWSIMRARKRGSISSHVSEVVMTVGNSAL